MRPAPSPRAYKSRVRFDAGIDAAGHTQQAAIVKRRTVLLTLPCALAWPAIAVAASKEGLALELTVKGRSTKRTTN
ncbi:hypothetical protein LMG28140_00831 [Paraburkholderia metrosideri]|jgi:hypothetical protein|uniref:Uncharacterized protein n=1 Tax=Paraburkholderia metrosideri TaxID=580937 RepID=A0ABM8NC45_9BURK|nr:hypothetical protein LMG28140_00831 [Paraburkholderia metrosideri]